VAADIWRHASPLETGGLIMLKKDMHTLYAAAEKITDKWGVLRYVYQQKHEEIIAASRRHIRGTIDPYFVDWMRDASPIETRAWIDIRGLGTPLYPQFPLFNYFIDFANPYLKVGVELDGKDWHDPVKDRERDEFLESVGWHIYRITGKEAHKIVEIPDSGERYKYDDHEIDAILEDYFLNTSEGVIAAIDRVYFAGDNNGETIDLCMRTLDSHRLAAFDIGPEQSLAGWRRERELEEMFSASYAGKRA
jgi:hypothetical protein